MNKVYDTPEYIYSDPEYTNYLIQYVGNIEEEYKGIQNLYITIINEDYAILTYKSVVNFSIEMLDFIKNIIIENGKDPGLILYLREFEIYTLHEFTNITSDEITSISSLKIENSLNLTGDKITVGIISTGIDYLNEEFIKENGETKINFIWDQTIKSDKVNRGLPYGSLYIKSQINKAIELKKNGGDPYSIVPSNDENGQGTSVAGIIGAIGKNPQLKGVAPECEFAIVKLSPSVSINKALNINVPTYNVTAIFTALEVLKNYAINYKKQMIMFLPLGTSLGSHTGLDIIDAYIKTILTNTGIAIVTGTGNERDEGGHTSGIIQKRGDIDEVNLVVATKETFIVIEIWVYLPDIMEISLVSPSGEETGFISAKINTNDKYSFILEESTANIYYYIPEEFTGKQLIKVYINNIKSGTWKIRLLLKMGDGGKYHIWIPQSGIKDKDTKFVPYDPYGTFTIPADNNSVISVAAYNQNNKNILNYSGSAFKEESLNNIDFAAPGVNIQAVGLNNKTVVVNGTAVAGAIGAGICALLFEWGIVRGNFVNMYSPSLKTFINRGTERRKGDVYPNPQLGFGIINYYKIFEEM